MTRQREKTKNFLESLNGSLNAKKSRHKTRSQTWLDLRFNLLPGEDQENILVTLYKWGSFNHSRTFLCRCVWLPDSGSSEWKANDFPVLLGSRFCPFVTMALNWCREDQLGIAFVIAVNVFFSVRVMRSIVPCPCLHASGNLLLWVFLPCELLVGLLGEMFISKTPALVELSAWVGSGDLLNEE